MGKSQGWSPCLARQRRYKEAEGQPGISTPLDEKDSFPLKVKNTFIDVDAKFIEFVEEESVDAVLVKEPRRQVSEPAQGSARRQFSHPIVDKQDYAIEMRNHGCVAEEVEVEAEAEAKADEEAEGWDRLVTAENWNAPGYDQAAYSSDLAVPGGTYLQPMVCPMVPILFGAMDGMADQGGASGVVIPPSEWGDTCMVTMHNVPKKYTHSMLLQELNHTGFQGTFHSVHLHQDPATGGHQGSAVVDFISPGYAWMFKLAYEGRKMNHFAGNECISVTPACSGTADSGASGTGKHQQEKPPPASGSSAVAADKARAPKNRRRRGAGSLIDLAKQRMAMAQRAAENGVALAGAPALAQQPTAQVAGQTESTTTNFCPYCGGKTQAGFKFCSFCGASLALG
mmetsp:Transcript_64432/g.167422  ORF Transcript_64432/g.167422 Transcript_64432/m.167422 type:complete len:397 (-) Transcript_64432:173-1363(-)